MQKLTDSDIIYPLSEMRSLREQLGKATQDRIRSATKSSPIRKSRTGFDNPIYLQARDLITIPPTVCDIVTGAINTTGERINYRRIFNLFQSLSYIDTRRVQNITELDERQARRYVQICRIALPHLIRFFKTNPIEDHTLIH